MRVVVSSEFCEKRNRLINILSFPKFTLSVEGTRVVEEDAALIR